MGFCYKTGSISLGGKFRSSRNVTGLKAYLRMDMAGFKQLIHPFDGSFDPVACRIKGSFSKSFRSSQGYLQPSFLYLYF